MTTTEREPHGRGDGGGAAPAPTGTSDGGVRTPGVEEELPVVDPAGVPVPLGPEAPAVAARRGEGETPEQTATPAT